MSSIEKNKLIEPIKFTNTDLFLARMLALIVEKIARLRPIEITGEDNIAQARQHLKNGGSVIVYFLPHTHILDPLIVTDFLQRYLIRPTQARLGWFASAKFGLSVPGMPELSRLQVLTFAGLRERVDTHFVVQEKYFADISAALSANPETIRRVLEEAVKINFSSTRAAINSLRAGKFVLALSPEGTRNQSGKLLVGQEGLGHTLNSANKRRNDANPSVIALPVALFNVKNIKGVSQPIEIVVKAPLTLENVEHLAANQVLTIEGRARGFSHTDALMVYLAQEFNDEMRGPYQSSNVSNNNQ